MSRFDDLFDNLMAGQSETAGEDEQNRTLGGLWEQIRRLPPARALVAGPLLFATVSIALVGLLAAAIFGALSLLILGAFAGEPAPAPGYTYH